LFVGDGYPADGGCNRPGIKCKNADDLRVAVMNLVEAIDLVKIYRPQMQKGGIMALDGLNLTIGQGEIFGLLGPNGAGKTTFLKVVLGIVGMTSGEARLFDLPPSDPRSREKVGYLPENHRFPHYLTGLGLLELTGQLYGLEQGDIDTRTEYLLPLVGMEKWASTKLGKYSKGMLQRIGLAQALVSDPELLLLDEPTDGVDPVGKVDIRNVLLKLKEEGKTVVLNSHLLSEVESVADRVAILSKGKCIKMSSVEELTVRSFQYEFVADFGSRFVDIPADVGRRLSITSNRLIVELAGDDKVDDVIDLLRMKRISIRSVQPLKVSLEQSFIETVTEKKEDQG
jgi:ABC-2 type transport system ATP-binding protein